MDSKTISESDRPYINEVDQLITTKCCYLKRKAIF